MKMSVTDFINQFNETIKSCEAYLFITRDSDLQKEAIISLANLQKQVLVIKDQAIKNKDERFANILLGYECVIQSLTSELQMWLNLKIDKPDQAWNDLILAQNSNIAAIRSDEGFGHLLQRSTKLEIIEKLIFPPQTFLSTGLLVGSQECSICNEEYENCEHIKGKPYMGEICRWIIKDIIELNHVAIVQNPADKGCRIIKDGTRNRMTLKVEEALQEDPEKI